MHNHTSVCLSTLICSYIHPLNANTNLPATSHLKKKTRLILILILTLIYRIIKVGRVYHVDKKNSLMWYL